MEMPGTAADAIPLLHMTAGGVKTGGAAPVYAAEVLLPGNTWISQANCP